MYVDDVATGTIRIYSATSEMSFAGHPTVGAACWLHTHGHLVDTLHVPAGDIPVTPRRRPLRRPCQHDLGQRLGLAPASPPPTTSWPPATSYSAGHTFIWSWQDEPTGVVRARAFAPAMNVEEDEATGSAVTQLTAHLARDLLVVQGAGSHLHTTHEPPTHATVGGRVHWPASRASSRSDRPVSRHPLTGA